MSLAEISKLFTETTLDEIVRKVGGTTHTSWNFGASFKKGDSYLSKVYRLRIYGINEETGEKFEIHTIVKGMPDNRARRRVFRSVEFFRNEINFYTKVLPIWEDFQARHKAKMPFQEYPKCYATHCDGENDFIVLEDISVDGYGGTQRTEFISLEDSLLIMRTLGRFHAVSIALRALEPENYKKIAVSLEETYYSEKQRNWYVGFLELACNVAKDAVAKTYPGTKYDQLTNKFCQSKHLFADLCHLVSADTKLSAVSHGDCWVPNFLTCYNDKGVPVKTKMIDFQLARTASIANDITFFIYSCTNQEMRENSYEKLLKAYHSAACDLLVDLGADAGSILSWEALREELKQFGRFGCGMGIESLIMSMLEEDEVADLDEIKETDVLQDVWNVKPFAQAEKRQRLAQMFKHAIDQEYVS